MLNSTDQRPQGSPMAHSILKSTDHGSSFVPADLGLYTCSSGECQYLPATHLVASNNLLFSNAGQGQNLLVSSDQGNTWSALSGSLDLQVCTHSIFAVQGQAVVQGGECPLDQAFLRHGTLTSNQSGWASGQDLSPSSTPELENRNVIALAPVPDTSTIFAGIEGAILLSNDNGATFSFVLKEPVDTSDNFYPYVEHIVAPSKRTGTLVAGGMNKATFNPYLRYSKDSGDHWTDISSLLPGANDHAIVTGMIEDSQGRILLAITDYSSGEAILARLQLPD